MHFSQLDQINRDTAKRPGFAWDYATGATRRLEATPIVVDGVMYASGSTGRVHALHADTGKEIWTFDPRSDSQVSRHVCCDDVNRGVVVYGDMVYVASLDGALRQLGVPQWDDVFSKADFKAVHAYLIDEAWKVYRDEPGASPVAPSQLVH